MSCLNPYYNKRTRTVCSCGHCAGCVKQKGQDWIFRLSQEIKSHQDSLFVTLTYNADNLPAGNFLVKPHLVNFIKRFRERLRRHGFVNVVKYFCCGEYGDLNGRPHYHILFFGIGPEFRDQIEQCWQKGFTCVKLACFEHAPYISSYILKSYQKIIREVHEVGRRRKYVRKMIDGRPSPFITFSNGIGKSWLETKDAETAQREGYCVLRGQKFSVPKYYLNFWDRNKSVYDREVSRCNRLNFELNLLKNLNYVKSWFDPARYMFLKKTVYERLWKARSSDKEQSLRKFKQRLNKRANQVLDYYWTMFDVLPGSGYDCPDDLYLGLKRPGFITPQYFELCKRFAWFDSFLSDVLEYEKQFREYEDYLLPFRNTVSEHSLFREYLFYELELTKARRRRFRLTFSRLRQKDKVLIAKLTLKKKGVL